VHVSGTYKSVLSISTAEQLVKFASGRQLFNRHSYSEGRTIEISNVVYIFYCTRIIDQFLLDGIIRVL
jgi:hypothetical protein